MWWSEAIELSEGVWGENAFNYDSLPDKLDVDELVELSCIQHKYKNHVIHCKFIQRFTDHLKRIPGCKLCLCVKSRDDTWIMSDNVELSNLSIPIEIINVISTYLPLVACIQLLAVSKQIRYSISRPLLWWSMWYNKIRSVHNDIRNMHYDIEVLKACGRVFSIVSKALCGNRLKFNQCILTPEEDHISMQYGSMDLPLDGYPMYRSYMFDKNIREDDTYLMQADGTVKRIYKYVLKHNAL